MSIRKIQIISNDLSYGPMPDENDEIEQHMTLNNKGQVWLSRYRYGEGKGRYPLIKKEYFRISDKDTKVIFEFAAELMRGSEISFATDVGCWDLIVCDDAGNKIKKQRSLFYSDSKDVQGFCSTIRNAVNTEKLLLLDGGSAEDE